MTPGNKKVPPGHKKVPLGRLTVTPGHKKVPPGHKKVPFGRLTVSPGHKMVPPGHKKVPRGGRFDSQCSGRGLLHLREELFKELTSNCELARCVLNNEKQRCINNVEKYIASVIKKEFSFGKRNSESMWKFLGEFYACNLPNSFKQSAPSILETSVTESSSSPLKLSSLTNSVNEIGSADSKKRKERDLDSSVRGAAYGLRSLRFDSSGDNSGGGVWMQIWRN